MKEGALLTNVFNRLARSVLYEAKNNFEGNVPLDDPSAEVVALVHRTLRSYDQLMQKAELHSVMSIMDEFIRAANKHWADGIKAAENNGDEALRRQVLSDSAYLLWAATMLMHPIVPAGCEEICSYLNFQPETFFSWDHDFLTLTELAEQGETDHPVRELPPRTDFFKKHPSQFKK